MNSPQHSLATFAQRSPYSADAGGNLIDEDVPLGWECADPALQIDCWGEEAAQPSQPHD